MVVVIGGMGSVWGALLASLLDRGAQRLRGAAAAEGRHRADLRGDGGGAGGAAVGPPRADPRSSSGRRAAGRWPTRPALSPHPGWTVAALVIAGRPAARPADVLDLDRGGDLRVRALRGEPAPADGGGRHGVVRPRGLLRPRRLRRRARSSSSPACPCRPPSWLAPAGGRARRRRVRLLLRAAHQHLLRDAHAGLRPDRLRDRPPVGRRHRRRQRPPERLARVLARDSPAATTTGPCVATRGRHRAAAPGRGLALRPHPARGPRPRAARGGAGGEHPARCSGPRSWWRASWPGSAGAVFAFLKGSVFPVYTESPMSVQPLVMVLLGGVGVALGPAHRRGGLQAARYRDHALHRLLAARAGRDPGGAGARASRGASRACSTARALVSAAPRTAAGAGDARALQVLRRGPRGGRGRPRDAEGRDPRPRSAPTGRARPRSSTCSPASSGPTRARCASRASGSAGCRRTRSGVAG